MKCDEIQSHLSAYRDGEGSSERRWRIRVHLKDCPMCRCKIQRLEELCLALDDAPPPPEVPDGFASRVVAKARDRVDQGTSPEREDRPRLGVLWQVAAAAAVLIVGLGGGLFATPLWTATTASDEPDLCLFVEYTDASPPGSLADIYRDVDDPRVY